MSLLKKRGDVGSPNRSEVSEGQTTAYYNSQGFNFDNFENRERPHGSGLNSEASDGPRKFFAPNSRLSRKKNHSVDYSAPVRSANQQQRDLEIQSVVVSPKLSLHNSFSSQKRNDYGTTLSSA